MSVIAKKYNGILFEIIPRKSAEEFYSLLSWLSSLLKEHKLLDSILQSPIVSLQDKVNLLSNIVKCSKDNVPDLLINLITLLLKNKNLKILPEITNLFYQNLLKEKGFTEVKVTFAFNPTNEQSKNVESMLNKEFNIKSVVSVNVDKAIIAGFIATFDAKRLDASLNNSFTNLTNHLPKRINLY